MSRDEQSRGISCNEEVLVEHSVIIGALEQRMNFLAAALEEAMERLEEYDQRLELIGA